MSLWVSCKVAKTDCKRYDCGCTNVTNSSPPQLRQVEGGQKGRREVREMQDKLARLSAMPTVRVKVSRLYHRNGESKWPQRLEPDQDDSVPSFPMYSSNRGHMLKGISRQQLFYRSPILKRKEKEKTRHQLERLGVPDPGDSSVPKANRRLCLSEGVMESFYYGQLGAAAS